MVRASAGERRPLCSGAHGVCLTRVALCSLVSLVRLYFSCSSNICLLTTSTSTWVGTLLRRLIHVHCAKLLGTHVRVVCFSFLSCSSFLFLSSLFHLGWRSRFRCCQWRNALQRKFHIWALGQHLIGRTRASDTGREGVRWRTAAAFSLFAGFEISLHFTQPGWAGCQVQNQSKRHDAPRAHHYSKASETQPKGIIGVRLSAFNLGVCSINPRPFPSLFPALR
ncbi:uncharacterized protein J3D65DRAFT_229592 [Phyllosticta citribraziliensis]|uniref:Uncharacterized protein n=1 Tax=Phyllosticta citribraziliensis TaxID=989973 RepID=A0ABR1M5F7_9PEZI